MKKTVYIWSSALGIAILIVGLIGLYEWLMRPLPIALDDPKTQSIKNVLVKSHQLETLLFCFSESDVNILDEVYKDTTDYKQTRNHRVLISKYLGEEMVDGSGYLTFKKAYFLWSKSGDPYPSGSPNPTSVSLTAVAPTAKPVRYCPNPLAEPELLYQSISMREDKAIAVYGYGPYQLEAILRQFDGEWFIVSSQALSISP